MWSYYGSKGNVVDLYPSPKHGKVIEPFAGSARYSLKWFDRDVLLVDRYPIVIEIWQYLQQASEADILGLPKIQKGEKVSDYNVSGVEKNLLGFLVQVAQGQPRNTTGTLEGIDVEKSLRSIAKQLYKIRHWKFICGDCMKLENETATWFIDPPYQFGGEHQYKFNNKTIDYSLLGEWCKSRNGQIIVCENTKADWLPFYSMRDNSGAIKMSTEAIWSNERHDFMSSQLSLFTPSNTA